MSTTTPHAAVRHTPLSRKKVPDALADVDTVCNVASGCALVQNDPMASQALLALKESLASTQGSLTKRMAAAQALAAAITVLGNDFATLLVTFATYEAAVRVLANGDAAVIREAGLLSRGPKTTPPALEKVSAVHGKPGKRLGDAVLTWPKAPGATGYAIEVNLTPQSPDGPWTALNSGTSRRRTVKASAPGAQLLARVASLGSDGTRSDWSDAILATAR